MNSSCECNFRDKKAQKLPHVTTFGRLGGILLWWVVVQSQLVNVVPRKVPEASSTLLQMHRLYLRQPPHDRTLYDTLAVSPNATAADISKAYRRLLTRYHPDKATDKNSQEMLEKVQAAYEVLKTDATRLPYHRYGLVEPTQAVLVLTGRGRKDDPDTEALIRLMGFHREGEALSQKGRLLLLATDLVEKVRPVVEGRISQKDFLDRVAADCDRLKKLPLGTKILRCIGRAYKHAGQGYLSSHSALVPETLREGLRQVKLLGTAAGWWGRAVVAENLVSLRKAKRSSNRITFDGWAADDCNDSDFTNAPTDVDIRENERQKAQEAVLQSTQIEALWKVCKIDLYRRIRQACDIILSGERFFFSANPQHVDGWVGSKGHAVDTRVGLVRAATALKLMGEVMVERSKEGTAWLQ